MKKWARICWHTSEHQAEMVLISGAALDLLLFSCFCVNLSSGAIQQHLTCIYFLFLIGKQLIYSNRDLRSVVVQDQTRPAHLLSKAHISAVSSCWNPEKSHRWLLCFTSDGLLGFEPKESVEHATERQWCLKEFHTKWKQKSLKNPWEVWIMHTLRLFSRVKRLIKAWHRARLKGLRQRWHVVVTAAGRLGNFHNKDVNELNLHRSEDRGLHR